MVQCASGNQSKMIREAFVVRSDRTAYYFALHCAQNSVWIVIEVIEDSHTKWWSAAETRKDTPARRIEFLLWNWWRRDEWAEHSRNRARPATLTPCSPGFLSLQAPLVNFEAHSYTLSQRESKELWWQIDSYEDICGCEFLLTCMPTTSYDAFGFHWRPGEYRQFSEEKYMILEKKRRPFKNVFRSATKKIPLLFPTLVFHTFQAAVWAPNLARRLEEDRQLDFPPKMANPIIKSVPPSMGNLCVCDVCTLYPLPLSTQSISIPFLRALPRTSAIPLISPSGSHRPQLTSTLLIILCFALLFSSFYFVLFTSVVSIVVSAMHTAALSLRFPPLFFIQPTLVRNSRLESTQTISDAQRRFARLYCDW